MATQVTSPQGEPVRQYPEKTWGPFPGGTGLALWRSHTMTSSGVRYFWSLKVRHRRYKNPQTGQWMDGSLLAKDLPALILAMEAARQYMASTRLPGPEIEEDMAEGEVPNEAPPIGGEGPRPDADIPF